LVASVQDQSLFFVALLAATLSVEENGLFDDRMDERWPSDQLGPSTDAVTPEFRVDGDLQKW
jgi:hypothetical protein